MRVLAAAALSAAAVQPIFVSALTGLAIPSVVHLIAHVKAPQWVKATVGVLLAALSGALTTVVFAPHESATAYGTAILTAWVTSLSANYAGLGALAKTLFKNVGVGANLKPIVPPPPVS